MHALPKILFWNFRQPESTPVRAPGFCVIRLAQLPKINGRISSLATPLNETQIGVSCFIRRMINYHKEGRGSLDLGLCITLWS